MTKELTELELKKIIDRQQKIIRNYELTGGLVSVFRKFPFMGYAVRFLATIFGSKTKAGTRIINNVKNKKPEIIAVVNPNYSGGVRSSTFEMVQDVVEVSDIYSRKKAIEIAEIICSFGPQKVLISGYANGHDMLAEELKRLNPNLRLFVLIHSAFLWFDVYPAENHVFERFINMASEGTIEKIGFCKRDLAEYFKDKGLNSYFVMNRFYPQKHTFRSLSKDKIKIGVFGRNMWHRNLTNQIIASLWLKNTEVHTNETPEHFFFDKKRVIAHGFLPKIDFLKIFEGLDIIMYISLTECFPMSAIESMQYGIPCLVSDTSDVYKWNKRLKSWLTVSTIDSPVGISKKINEVIDNYDDIQKEIKAYLPILKEKTEKSITEFLK